MEISESKGTIDCPARTPDMTPLDFLDHVKHLQDIQARIVHEINNMFLKMLSLWLGEHFENLIK